MWYEADGDYSFLYQDQNEGEDGSPGVLGETVEDDVVTFGPSDFSHDPWDF